MTRPRQRPSTGTSMGVSRVGVGEHATSPKRPHRRAAATQSRHWKVFPERKLNTSSIAAVALSLGTIYLCTTLYAAILLSNSESQTGGGTSETVKSSIRVLPPRKQRVAVGGITSRRLLELGYTKKPRSMGYYFNSDNSLIGMQVLDPYLVRRQKEKSVFVHAGAVDRKIHIEDGSRDYRHRLADPIPEGCKAQYDWQVTAYPTCNSLFEFDFTQPYVIGADGMAYENIRIVSHGYWRDVTMLRENDGNKVAIKTMRYQHEFEARNYDRHRKDALVSEQLTSSPYIANIYGFCGNSGVFDYAPDGDIDSLIWPDYEGDYDLNMTRMEKLNLAHQVSRAVAAAHNFDKEGQASVAHTDISPGQFLLIDGIYKLNDFNRARMIFWDETNNEPCPFHVGNNPGKFRSPEEYSYLGESEKVDVYSMGNVFYSLMTGLWPFEEKKTKEAQQLIMNHKRPPFPRELKKSTDPLDKALLRAIKMCWHQNPEERATARKVEQYLVAEIAKHNQEDANQGKVTAFVKVEPS